MEVAKMPNMSYCRFTNTATDLRDCLNTIRRGERLSASEADAGRKMFLDFLSFCQSYDIIDGYDSEILDDLFNGIRK